ncbi:MAG: imidazoleglycerol-phosphate dehydratase HisB [Desulfobacterales bacterium]|jgi:imidazoleglycerol-phosphate dehydratase
MKRISETTRKTKETEIEVRLNLDGKGRHDIATGIPFFDHMLTLFAAHGFFDLDVSARGDLDVDTHHTVEDVGLVLGDAFNTALGDRKGINRFGHAVTPMDDALSAVTIDLSNRPFLVYNVPALPMTGSNFNIPLAKEFFKAFVINSGMNLHVNVPYGENEHHIIEAIFKATGRAMDEASAVNQRIRDVRSTKGTL